MPDPPAALFRYSGDRSGDHPVEHLKTFAGILLDDIYAGFNRLYAVGTSLGPIVGGACWAHSRSRFYEPTDIAASKRRGKIAPPISPLALKAAKRTDVLFDIERGIIGDSAEERLAVRKELSAPVLAERVKLSKHSRRIASAAETRDERHRRPRPRRRARRLSPAPRNDCVVVSMTTSDRSPNKSRRRSNRRSSFSSSTQRQANFAGRLQFPAQPRHRQVEMIKA